MKALYNGNIYDVYDITEHSYLVCTNDDEVIVQLPKEECEVV